MNKCPVCNSTYLQKYSFDNHRGKITKSFIKHFIAYMLAPALKIFHSKYFDWVNMKMLFSPFFNIVRCTACGYGIYDRPIDANLIEKYYNTLYPQAAGLPTNKWHQRKLYLDDDRANGQFRCVKRWVENFTELNILEIGAAGAFFSRLLKERHPGQVSLNVVEAGNGWEAYYHEIGLSLRAKFFPFESNQKFHYIHTSHWFEHITDVDDVLSKIKSLLLKNGLLFIEVPNCTDEYYLVDSGDSPHIHFFTKNSLCILLERHGFKTLTIGEYGLTIKEEMNRRKDPVKYDKKIIQEGKLSIKENIPRNGGEYLRALFEFS